jgi:chromate transporter
MSLVSPPPTDEPAAPAQAVHPDPSIGPLQLFRLFSRVAVSGFGGTLPFAYRELVERQRWLSEREFIEALSLGQLLPGPNICNVAVMVGYRFAGYRGVGSALAGLVAAPFVFMIVLGILYEHFGGVVIAQRALAGMSAVAAGLVLATGLKMAMALPRHWRPWLFVGLAFAGVGLLRLPLLGVLAVLAPVGLLAAARERA